MVKINFWKDFLKILTGFLVSNTINSFYFQISGNFPSPPPGVPQLTPEINVYVIAGSLIIIGILIYLVFFRGGRKVMDLRGASQMLVGFFLHRLFTGFSTGNYLIIVVSLVLVCIFIYIGFFRK